MVVDSDGEDLPTLSYDFGNVVSPVKVKGSADSQSLKAEQSDAEEDCSTLAYDESSLRNAKEEVGDDNFPTQPLVEPTSPKTDSEAEPSSSPALIPLHKAPVKPVAVHQIVAPSTLEEDSGSEVDEMYKIE